MNDEETVTLRLPDKMLEFANFYAVMGNIDRDTLLAMILTEQLKKVKEQFKALPYMDIPETY